MLIVMIGLQKRTDVNEHLELIKVSQQVKPIEKIAGNSERPGLIGKVVEALLGQ